MTTTDKGYEIRVHGHLDGSWLDWFEGIFLANEENGDAVLTLPRRDPALLHGVLARIRDLNLELISVKPLPRQQSEEIQ